MRDYWIIQLGVRKPLEADDRETKEESTWSDPKFPRRDPCNLPGCCDNDYISMDDDLDSGHAKDLISEQEYIFVRTSNPDELTEDDLMIFPIRVLGFVLRDRTWAHMDIDKVTDVQPLDAGLDALSLPKGHKDTLLAMVRNHSRGSASVDHIPDDQTQFDLIPGKGKGLIVLLHGQPGVGKTSTAESIAAHTNRPLFPITCGSYIFQSCFYFPVTLHHLSETGFTMFYCHIPHVIFQSIPRRFLTDGMQATYSRARSLRICSTELFASNSYSYLVSLS